DHPLTQHGRLTLPDLCRFDAVLPGPMTFTRSPIESRFAASGLSLSVGLSTNYLETLKMMASIGLGWSRLPESLIGGELYELDGEHPAIQRQLGYGVHRSRTLSNATHAMLELLNAASDNTSRSR